MSSLAFPIAVILASPVLFVALAHDRRRRHQQVVERHATSRAAVNALTTVVQERALADLTEAFPPSELTTHNGRREIQRDQRRRRGASAQAWSGRWKEGPPFDLFLADRQIRVVRGSNAALVVRHHELVRCRIENPSMPQVMVVCPANDFKGGVVTDFGWYKSCHLDATRALKISGLDDRHEVHIGARDDAEALLAAFTPTTLAWLSTVDPRIRFELVEGALNTFQLCLEGDPPTGPIEVLVDAARHMAEILSTVRSH